MTWKSFCHKVICGDSLLLSKDVLLISNSPQLTGNLPIEGAL